LIILTSLSTKVLAVPSDGEREFKIEQRYLNLPIKNVVTKKKKGTASREVTLLVDGKVVVRNDIQLADGEPDWWAPMEVGAWKGKTITLQVKGLPENSKALSSIEQSDTIRDSENLYREPLRGQFHFSAKRGWNNDPNGMVFFNGEYHMFFQHNPYGWGSGNKHWGHAVSKDLIHWDELGDKLAPDEMGMMFSGSAVVDWNNTCGFGQQGKPPMVLIYTANGNQSQNLAYSTDGRSVTKYQGNPVIPHLAEAGGIRDPKVIWHAPTKQWVMTLFVREIDKHYMIYFFTSSNLQDWKYTSKTEGLFECPDFFELPVDNDAAKKKWVLTAASSEYMIGSFDGTTFTPETKLLPGHGGIGKNFYAAQTFSDIPEKDGRRIQIGWWQTVPARFWSFSSSNAAKPAQADV